MNKSIALEQLENQIRERYDGLTKRLKQVAKYILDNTNSVVFDTVATIAERADVPPSTLIRFANAFGFSGFNEMKQVFRDNLLEETMNYPDRIRLLDQADIDISELDMPSHILNSFVQSNTLALKQLNLHTKVEQLQQAVNLLDAANTIFILGLKRSFSIANYLNYTLQHLGCRSFLIDGVAAMFEEQLNMIRPNDVIVAISFSPYAEETLKIVEATSRNGIKHIAITDSQISPLVSFSDVAFIIKEAQVSGFRSQCATMTLAQTLAISLGVKRSHQVEQE
ncbi:Fe-S cluster assembly protein HesB [Mergibacter septicus]|uniref:Fe-S cluster assembly protein HesB n=1 Tax=Mergibacter septicus TaxID=221402 RepID=A0A8E3MHK1_9PAST|nr:MurR/RpiR family transcriptional regulator [Mergibacter septicus]AWX16298.1 Fe-S cluster assembly protein HesB [Mergibacter septicus]QDJ15548.1 Fe-S cluster assembly protein HesB [Mergibacter septicus]UTU48870.1 MurR/RpiR family transcriptional regulator [Mergibacter septicus]WMR96827.1 MurR/RpiR family transcriptional regulator [Mergibacter septicus]